ncbi:MAG: GspE/PulE family protein [Candidatus Paceibacterota bacterium]
MIDSKSLDEQLSKEHHRAEEADAERRAKRFGFPYLNLVSVKVPTEIKAMQLVKEEVARKAKIVPLQLIRTKLLIAAFDPTLSEASVVFEELKKKFELNIVVVSLTSLAHGWGYYRYVHDEAKEISGKVDIDEERLRDLLDRMKTLKDIEHEIEQFKSPRTSQLLEIILSGSMGLRASDIHMEPTEETGILRYRIDGLLHTAYEHLPPQTYRSIVMRIKLLSNLKLNVVTEPQDGRFTIRLHDRDIEIRTSIIPSEYGETIVMRLLDPLDLKVNLEELGWRKDDLAIVHREIEKPNGLILNTGPTGSGKTTTLYAFLKNIVSSEIKVITVEDPVEYHIEGISQTQVNTNANYTFASGLRSILRQDPDVILIGEIRDKETAEIALNAALTGHLVFSTLHTNDAVGAIPRLLDLGAKQNIMGPALSLVIAQRLVRVLCPHCKVEKPLSPAIIEKAKLFVNNLPTRVDKTLYTHFTSFEPKGCEKCGNFGYRGRTSLFELFIIDPVVEEAIYKNPTGIELINLAKNQGMVTMQEDGTLKVFLGITSIDEVERTTGRVEWLHEGK